MTLAMVVVHLLGGRCDHKDIVDPRARGGWRALHTVLGGQECQPHTKAM
jgi:hypothetical protein